MQAVILAGGRGTRLRPYTNFFPKPLVPIGEMPILEIVIRQLKAGGFGEIVIVTGHLSSLIEAYFGDGSKFGVNIRYCKEDKPLGTAGGLKCVSGLEDNFLVMNGDVLTTLNFSKFFQAHCKDNADATIATFKREVKIDFGVVETDKNGNLMGYVEKPTYEKLVSMGVNALNKKSLSLIKAGESIGMPELLLRLKKDGNKIRCYEFDGYWLDIGRVEDYETAQKEFEGNKFRFFHEA